jgi:hypothetical protein
MFGSTAQGSTTPIQVQGDYSAILYRKGDGVPVALIGPRSDIGGSGHIAFHGYNSANWFFNNGNVSIGGTVVEAKLDLSVTNDTNVNTALIIGTEAAASSNDQKFRIAVHGNATDNRVHYWTWNYRETTGDTGKDDASFGAMRAYVSTETTDTSTNSGFFVDTMLAGASAFVRAFQIRQDRGVFFYGATSGQDMFWDATSSGGCLIFDDNTKAKFGDGGDLEISHNGSDSYIRDTGTGNLIVGSSLFQVMDSTLTDNMIHATENGAVNLYYNASNKFSTASGGVTVTGDMTASGNVTAYSDARLKENVKPIYSALNKVGRMKGVTYDRIDSGEAGVGVLAQDLEEIAPELVQDGEYKSVAYGNLTAYLVEAIKELKTEVEELKKGSSK